MLKKQLSIPTKNEAIPITKNIDENTRIRMLNALNDPPFTLAFLNVYIGLFTEEMIYKFKRSFFGQI